MSDDERSYYETRLIREIEEIDARIMELRREQDALKRQLMKARWENNALRDVTRKNSANRVMVEQRILDELGEASKSLSTSALYKVAVLANFELKANTFRTHLHRLKERGMIESPRRGYWKLSDRKPS
ncbi:hypothetical protein QKW60_16460 [Defluviimonas aestuarii]|uniref:hypothetical protein n=1 Tax=Albidovulum aestuarii TaxID=1130726 RepID=UPI002499E4DF|nr:hypothetical protein [Defluviimonas aestuarii]MDI3338002.1 hypothetical protein [Defluviimonas aestuarii]